MHINKNWDNSLLAYLPYKKIINLFRLKAPQPGTKTCIILFLLQQIKTNFVAWNNMNLLSHSSAGQKSKISFTGLKPRHQQGWSLWELLGGHFLAFFRFQWPPIFFGSWPFPQSSRVSFQSLFPSSYCLHL